MDERNRTDPGGYIEAVVGALEALGIPTAGLTRVRYTDAMLGIAPRGPKRSAAIILSGMAYWGNDHYRNTLSLDLEWDEELGWTLHSTYELGGVRGDAHDLHGLPLRLLPEPTEVARYVQKVLGADHGFCHEPPRARRRAADHDPDLEAALAAYLPT